MTEPSTDAAAGKLTLLRVIGVAVVVIATGATVLFGSKYPQLAAVNTGLAWLVGKLLGVPIESVTQAVLKTMAPDKAVAMTVQAVQSLPPARAEAVAQGVLQEIAAHAVGHMPDAQAKYMTRALLDTIPPEVKARVLEKIVFISSMPPAAATEEPATEGRADGKK